MAIATLNNFVDFLCSASLLEIEQREELLRIQENFQSSRELAQELLRREWLTAFQANQILQGKAQELQFGSFHLLERIGEGGMGQVFKARQRGLNRVVALKVIRRECLSNSKAVARFQREIRLAGQLTHPHIVRAYDADQVDGVYYIAMELIDGVDLANLVRKQGPLPIPQACDYIRQAALGLQYAYERGLVHRDIKPANLLVTQRFEKQHASSARVLRPGSGKIPRSSGVVRRADFTYRWGMVKILDLGLARWTDPDTGRSATQLTQLGSVMGTPEFIAPEQARDSHKIDIRADLYSLGCTLYFLLAGQVPFPNGNLTEKLLQHQMDTPESVSVVRRRRMLKKGTLAEDAPADDVPYAIEELVRRLMAKKPEERHDTPAALAENLSSLLEQLAKGTLPAPPRVADPISTVEMPAVLPEAISADKSFDLKLESSSMLDKPIVALKPRSKLATRGLRTKVAFVAAGMLAVMAGLMVAVASSRSSRPSAAEPPIPKVDEVSWKKTVQKGLQKRVSWDEVRQELQRLRNQNLNGPLAKQIAEVIRLLPTPGESMDRGRLDALGKAVE